MSNCGLCGRPAVDRHHVTGRGASGKYLDPAFTVALCHDDHELVDADLRSLGIQGPSGGVSFLDGLALRLRRLSMMLGRVEGDGLLAWFALIAAAALSSWAEQLERVIAAFDGALPGWRLIEGMPGA
jgi:hypothetical protein